MREIILNDNQNTKYSKYYPQSETYILKNANDGLIADIFSGVK